MKLSLKFNYNYSECMVMKLDMAVPDRDNPSKNKGIDITSELTYKESDSLPNKPIFGLPRDHFSKYNHNTLGLIPLSWWCIV